MEIAAVLALVKILMDGAGHLASIAEKASAGKRDLTPEEIEQVQGTFESTNSRFTAELERRRAEGG
jgi:hypothetical protein